MNSYYYKIIQNNIIESAFVKGNFFLIEKYWDTICKDCDSNESKFDYLRNLWLHEFGAVIDKDWYNIKFKSKKQCNVFLLRFS